MAAREALRRLTRNDIAERLYAGWRGVEPSEVTRVQRWLRSVTQSAAEWDRLPADVQAMVRTLEVQP